MAVKKEGINQIIVKEKAFKNALLNLLYNLIMTAKTRIAGDTIKIVYLSRFLFTLYCIEQTLSSVLLHKQKMTACKQLRINIR